MLCLLIWDTPQVYSLLAISWFILNRINPTHQDFQVGIKHSYRDYEMAYNRQKYLNIHHTGRIAFVINCSVYINLSHILIIWTGLHYEISKPLSCIQFAYTCILVTFLNSDFSPFTLARKLCFGCVFVWLSVFKIMLGGHDSAAVTHSPPTSEVCSSNLTPYVGKFVVAYRWPAVNSTIPWPTVCAGFLWYDVSSVQSNVKTQINKDNSKLKKKHL